uniref:Uncharacterized protein n=1 Tax=Lotharella globosa TaxID=91324 RepID=A0A7S4DNM4_9EUKA
MSTEGGHWRMPSSAAATVKPFVIAFVAVAAICMLSIPASSLHKNGGLRMNSPGISRTGVVGVRRGDCALGKTSRRHHHLQNHIHKSSDVPAHALASQVRANIPGFIGTVLFEILFCGAVIGTWLGAQSASVGFCSFPFSTFF